MKKITALLLSLLTLVCFSCHRPGPESESNNGQHDNALSSGKFSINNEKTAVFSTTNMQYSKKQNFSFEKNAYSMIGDENKEIVNLSEKNCIDLFGWATSGIQPTENANKFYQPTDYNKDESLIGYGYGPATDEAISLTNNYEHCDWGSALKGYRTLSYDEWNYVLNKRNNSKNLCGFTSIKLDNGTYINGLLLLPDGWDTENNSIDKELKLIAWKKLSKDGAIFLPCSGVRIGNKIESVNSIGYYWTSTSCNDKSNSYALCFDFSKQTIEFIGCPRYYGAAVRLVAENK